MPTEYVTFIRELRRSFSEIGGVIPTSPALARLMVRPIKEASKEALSILEVGPGTGPITRQILKVMGLNDHFVVCEINPRFIVQLKKTLAGNKDFQRHRDRVKFFEGPVQSLGGSGLGDLPQRFDMIVSSLPFTNFSPETVEEILTLFRDLTGEEGIVTFIEYLGFRKIGAFFASKERKERVKGVDEVIKRWQKEVDRYGEVKTGVSFLNVPPAKAIHFCYQESLAA